MTMVHSAGHNDRGVERLRQMLRGRAAEDAIAATSGHYHPARGEEGVIVGAFAAIEPTDLGAPHYRGAIIASLTRGAAMRDILAGILGKATGPTRGRQRGDFLGRFTPNDFGLFSGTLGPSIGYATGAGLAAKLDGSGAVALVTFGDGTANSGLLYESLNLAGMLALPVVFVCQNNQFAVSMPSSRSIAGGSLVARAAAFGIHAEAVDGNDVEAVEAAVRAAAARARAGEGPSFIDAQTYRVSGHWVSDPGAYRDAEETRRWRERDPVAILAGRLVERGRLTAAEVEALAAETRAEAEAAMRRAEADPWPDAAVVDHRDAYV